MTKIYKFEPQEDRHYYKQDFLNVLRTSKGHLMGDVNWGQRLEDRYKKEFHSFRPDIKDNKIEYWEKSNVFF
jgi:hypothetical protein